jgi:FMN phosphatase YigB (HAD superfamily)
MTVTKKYWQGGDQRGNLLKIMKGIMAFNIRKLLYVLFFTLAFPLCNLFSANIIFDMNGVLVTQSGSFMEIGPFKFFGFFNPIHIEDTFFDFLGSLIPRRDNTPHAIHKDRLLPQIMCDWHTGLLTAQQIRDLIMKKLNELAPAFDSQRKVKLMEAIAHFIFTPERFVKVIKPLKHGVRILKKCYKQKDANGNRIHKIFILSNWDAESFPLLYENDELRKFLELADGIIISGLVGFMKPSRDIFEYAFGYFMIDPDLELTCFIDDELSNIKAARMLNKRLLKCIHCANFDFNTVDKTLHRIGIY